MHHAAAVLPSTHSTTSDRTIQHEANQHLLLAVQTWPGQTLQTQPNALLHEGRGQSIWVSNLQGYDPGTVHKNVYGCGPGKLVNNQLGYGPGTVYGCDPGMSVNNQLGYGPGTVYGCGPSMSVNNQLGYGPGTLVRSQGACDPNK